MTPPRADFLGLVEAGEALRARRVSSLELTDSTLQRMAGLDPVLGAYVTVTTDTARAAARRADSEMDRGGPRSLVHGVPVAVKDLFDTDGVPTMANSRVWADRVPSRTATAVHRLEQAGAVVLGKLQMSEFAIGAAKAGDLRPPARNPWALDRAPGGSSSGSAVALAAGLCFGSLGSDTGGSIRAPASHCGVVGLKPTFGRVSRHGMAMLSWSLDHAGPMGRRVGDVAALLSATAGRDPKDTTSAAIPVADYGRALTASVQGVRVGVPRLFIEESPVEDSVRVAFEDAVRTLETIGAVIVDVNLPDLSSLDAVFDPILFAEAAAIHAAGLHGDAPYGSAFRRRVLQGFLFSAIDYVQAQRGRTRLVREFDALMQGIDVLATPTMGIAGPPLDAEPDHVRSPFTRIFNVTGQPSISVPCGFSREGMPVGLLLSGRWYGEETILSLAARYESTTVWHDQVPTIQEIPAR